MKIAHISGINYPEFVQKGQIAFTLCDWILKDNSYRDFYNNSSMYKITDNMAAENGISTDIDKVLEAARLVNSNEIWASDKLYDRVETMKMTNEFIKRMTSEDKQRFTIIGIPQGNNFHEWLFSYLDMIENPDIDVIGMSKYSVPRAFEGFTSSNEVGKVRPIAVEWLYNKDLIKKPLHLSGGDNFIIDEINVLKKYPFVRSIDSNIAFKLGVIGIKIDECIREPKERLNHNVKNLTKEQLDIIEYNISKINEALI